MRIQEFNYTLDILQAILWQYNEATNMQTLLQEKQDWYDENQSQFWEDWYNNVFNLITANTFGLSIWSIILNVPNYLNSGIIPNELVFGFNGGDPPDNDYENFERGTFSNVGDVIVLTEEQQRLVLRLRFYQLVSRGAIPEINTFLSELFQTSGTVFSGNAWVLDGFDMTITYVFNFYLPKIMRSIINQLDLMPRPAWVGVKHIIALGNTFGFEEFYQNFENGNFYDGVF